MSEHQYNNVFNAMKDASPLDPQSVLTWCNIIKQGFPAESERFPLLALASLLTDGFLVESSPGKYQINPEKPKSWLDEAKAEAPELASYFAAFVGSATEINILTNVMGYRGTIVEYKPKEGYLTMCCSARKHVYTGSNSCFWENCVEYNVHIHLEHIVCAEVS